MCFATTIFDHALHWAYQRGLSHGGDMLYVYEVELDEPQADINYVSLGADGLPTSVMSPSRARGQTRARSRQGRLPPAPTSGETPVPRCCAMALAPTARGKSSDSAVTPPVDNGPMGRRSPRATSGVTATTGAARRSCRDRPTAASCRGHTPGWPEFTARCAQRHYRSAVPLTGEQIQKLGEQGGQHTKRWLESTCSAEVIWNNPDLGVDKLQYRKAGGASRLERPGGLLLVRSGRQVARR